MFYLIWIECLLKTNLLLKLKTKIMAKKKPVLPKEKIDNMTIQNLVTFDVVQKKVLAYYDKMKQNEPSQNGKTQYLQFYIDKNSFKRMSKISKKDGFDCFAAFFGLDDGGNPDQLTVCFVGV